MLGISFYRNAPRFWNIIADSFRAWTCRPFVWCVHGVAVHWRGFWRWHFKSLLTSVCFICLSGCLIFAFPRIIKELEQWLSILFLTHAAVVWLCFLYILDSTLFCFRKSCALTLWCRAWERFSCVLWWEGRRWLVFWVVKVSNVWSIDVSLFILQPPPLSAVAGLLWLVTCNY